MGMRLVLRRLSPAQLAAARRDPELAGGALVDDADADELLDLDKLWDGLGYLLTGASADSSGPGAAIWGGDEVGDDLGYGPARLMDPPAVAAAAAALAATPEAALRARWDPAAMMDADLYPSIWDEGDAVLDADLLPAFRALCAFYARAAAAGDGLALGLT